MSNRRNHVTTMNRRAFFKKAAAVGCGSALGGAALWRPEAARAAVTLPTGPMPRRPFGRSGIMVSTLSLGGMFDILNNRLMLAKALEWGINYWDTAEGYGGGRSEEGIGLWLARRPETRPQIFLVSKLSLRRGGDFTARLDECLKRLHTDYLDMLFVHGIRSADDLAPELAGWSQAMKKDGKLKLFGFSTHSNMEDCLEGAARLPWIDGIMFTYNYRLMHEPRMNAAVEACHRAGIGLTAMKTQGGGPVASDSEAEIKLAGRFLQKGFTAHQARLMAVWEDRRIASICSQMPNLTIMATNAAAASPARLSNSDRTRLARFARQTHGDYCAGCGALCSGALAQSVPVSDVMRCLMYARSYQDVGLARDALQALPDGERALLTRLDFTAAEKACPRRLPIGRLMREAADILA